MHRISPVSPPFSETSQVNTQLNNAGEPCPTISIIFSVFVWVYGLSALWGVYNRGPPTMMFCMFLSAGLAIFGYLLVFIDRSCAMPMLGTEPDFNWSQQCNIDACDHPMTCLGRVKYPCCQYFGKEALCACYSMEDSQVSPTMWQVRTYCETG